MKPHTMVITLLLSCLTLMGGEPFFTCDFEREDWFRDWGLRSLPRNTERAEFGGRSCLRVSIVKGGHYGTSFKYKLREALGREPEELYAAYDVYYKKIEGYGGKSPGFDGTYGRAGWGGRTSDGVNGWSARFSGKLQTDLRLQPQTQSVGERPVQVELPSGVSRNENIFKLKLEAIAGAFTGVAEVDTVLTGYANNLEGIEDLSYRELVDPYRLEVHALYISRVSSGVRPLEGGQYTPAGIIPGNRAASFSLSFWATPSLPPQKKCRQPRSTP